METLRYDQLPQGGFAGLKERQFVTDSRVFGARKRAATSEGIGNFVYLADANFIPHGETGLHPHHEVDVISVMMEGRISHAGSLEHGTNLEAGSVQVQRAGGEGFTHNEVNPDDTTNRMIQLWVLPDEPGEPAGYKTYTPEADERTRIYGGSKGQTTHFYSQTAIDYAELKSGKTLSQDGDVLAFLARGTGKVNGQVVEGRTLVRVENLHYEASADSVILIIYKLK